MRSKIEQFYKNVLTGSGKYITDFALLMTCGIFIFVLPIIPLATGWISITLFSVIIFLAASSISLRVIIVGLVAIILEWITRATDLIYLNYFAELTTNLFIIYMVGSVVIQIMKREDVTIYTLIEALNGYLLLAIMFVSLVSFCELHLPGSFSGTHKSGLELTYYTVITLTTTGYGDVTPQLPLAKSLSMLISVAGQFYVAVIVAILVGKYSSGIKK